MRVSGQVKLLDLLSMRASEVDDTSIWRAPHSEGLLGKESGGDGWRYVTSSDPPLKKISLLICNCNSFM